MDKLRRIYFKISFNHKKKYISTALVQVTTVIIITKVQQNQPKSTDAQMASY